MNLKPITHCFQSLLLLFSLSMPGSALGQTFNSFEEAFQAGLASYSGKNFDEARLAFSQAIEKNPNSPEALTNLGLTEYQIGKKGAAIAYLRKAHWLDPGFSTPLSAMDFILPQLEIKEIPHEIQLWETVRENFIVPFSFTSFLVLTGICLFSTGWLFLSYIGQRRNAFRDEKALPAFPLIPSIIAVIFVGFVALSLAKFVDHQLPRGTIIADKVSVYSAPDEKSVLLFDLYPGLEVIVNNSDKDWVQVKYPGASTGWIPKASILQTSGRAAW
jgi:tetratricopeptide (TPR) repeat protein